MGILSEHINKKPYQVQSHFARRYYIPVMSKMSVLPVINGEELKASATFEMREIEFQLRQNIQQHFDNYSAIVFITDSEKPGVTERYEFNASIFKIVEETDFENVVLYELFSGVAKALKFKGGAVVKVWEEFMLREVMGYTKTVPTFASVPTAKSHVEYHGGRPKQLDHWKHILQVKVALPCDCEPIKIVWDTTLENVGIHLNDKHKWSREKIVDWMNGLHDAGVVDLTVEPLDPDRA